MAEWELLRSDLVQRNHRVGHGKDEVDVVLRHLLCDQSERGVILQGSETDVVFKRCKRPTAKMSLLIDHLRPPAIKPPESLFATGSATGAKVLQNNMRQNIYIYRHTFIVKTQQEFYQSVPNIKGCIASGNAVQFG